MRPQLRAWHGSWTTLIVTSVGTEPRTRAVLRTTLHNKRFGELREGVWMRPDNLELDLDARLRARVRIVQARDEAPDELAGQLWDLPSWARIGHRLLAEMSDATDVPARFVVAAAIVRHLLTDPVLPAELLPADWPGAGLRAAYNDFAAELFERRDGIRLVEAT
jgi:phenylacetic acid degradation operon negative regulatory protein